ncbi:MAG: GGDEF domain-containing protein [Gammaproteobacteria bacterium]|nr:MAG: GGDEF domain-containing protein [Gammaproteobacteria bacterium]
MYSHRFLPSKTLQLFPAKDVHAFIYGDTNSSGKSMASWVDFDQLIWQCNIEDDGKSHVCGFNIALGDSVQGKGKDLSSYQKVNLELDYSGHDKRLRFYTRNFVEGFSDENNIETSKFNNALLPTEFVNGKVSIDFKEFFVAEWWISQYQVPRKHMQPDFHNTVVFGVDLSYPTNPGIQTFHLKKLEFVGLWVSKERWYLGILVFWILIIFIGGGYNLWQLKRQNRAERIRLEALINQNSALEHETNHYKQLSMLDQLTGMLNRHGLSEYLQKNYDENLGRQASLIIIDIDYFKKINDAYGHEGGDAVLHDIAQVVRENIRSSDTAARWGGEEFVVVLPDTSALDAQLLAEELRGVVANVVFENLPELRVTISLGVGAINGMEPFHMLFRRVDVALYQAKAQGRNRVVMAV